jgi:hypothetical protein
MSRPGVAADADVYVKFTLARGYVWGPASPTPGVPIVPRPRSTRPGRWTPDKGIIEVAA